MNWPHPPMTSYPQTTRADLLRFAMLQGLKKEPV